MSESRATERGPRSQAVQTAKVGAERRREKRKEMRNLRRARIPVTAAALGTWADRHFSVLIHDDLVPAFFFFLEDIPSVRWPCACTHLLFSGDHEQQQLFQSRPVATLDGSKVGAVPGRDGTTPQRQPHPPRERPTNVLRMMQDHLQQTTVISHGRSQKTLAEQLHHRTKNKVAYEAVDSSSQACGRQAEARRLHEQKQETVEDEEAQRHLKELLVQLSQQNTATRSTQQKRRAGKERPKKGDKLTRAGHHEAALKHNTCGTSRQAEQQQSTRIS